jgi:2-polyprenyl-3-methyl-5-hydroxy-6-metoxy-1,4-benzoquinol methylase
MNKSFEQVFRSLLELDITQRELNYLNFHKDRYTYVIQELDNLMGYLSQDINLRVLDIGPAFQTFFLRKLFNFRVNSLGENHRFNYLKESEEHFNVDLNFTEDYEGKIIQHDVIIMCEVIEHLFTKSEIILAFILKFLKPGGYLIVQTPNAVSAFKRMRMLLGSNPYELIRRDRRGQYREYTEAD